ncbi:L,D-transpeptidase family protein [Hirschia litorea]|uniref:L,D-transpeptidase n=1 Tax=Hirschia litorea TaxID=1199156 RepID=A0ABW2IN89_9PROT
MNSPNHTKFNARDIGVITWQTHSYRCALGKMGVIPAEDKQEGDNKSPLGEWPMRRVFYRPDRVARPKTQLATCALTPEMGWCDDIKSPEFYNTLIPLPSPHRHEKLWREDGVYDIIIELGYNDSPPIIGKGSAIFMHLKRNEYEGTEGCVALAKEHLLSLLEEAKPGDVVNISR